MFGRGALATVMVVATALLGAANASGATLHVQVPNGSFSVQSVWSVDVPDNDFDSQAADEFTVPAGQVWTIEAIEMFGFAQGATPIIDAANAAIYSSAGAAPGQALFTQAGIPPGGGNCAPGQCDFTIPLTGAPKLRPGEYWVSGQAVMDTGAWRWAVNPPKFSYGKPAVWQNPGNGFSAGCPTFRPLLDCDQISAEAGRDLYLVLEGQFVDSRFSLGGFSSDGAKIKLRATFPGPGKVKLGGKKVRKVSKKVSGGASSLPIKPTKGAQRKLDGGRKVKLAVKATFTASGGVPFTQRATVKVIPVRTEAGAPALRLAG